MGRTPFQDGVDRPAQLGTKGAHPTRMVKDKLVEHKLYIDQEGQDMPEIRGWKRSPDGTPIEKSPRAGGE